MDRHLKLSTLAGGVAEELFQNELDRVLNNLDDPNTDHKAARSITLSFVFHTDEERRVSNVAIRSSSKLAGVKSRSTVIFLGRQQGVMTAVEQLTQEELFPRLEPRLELSPAPILKADHPNPNPRIDEEAEGYIEESEL